MHCKGICGLKTELNYPFNIAFLLVKIPQEIVSYLSVKLESVLIDYSKGVEERYVNI